VASTAGQRYFPWYCGCVLVQSCIRCIDAIPGDRGIAADVRAAERSAIRACAGRESFTFTVRDSGLLSFHLPMNRARMDNHSRKTDLLATRVTPEFAQEFWDTAEAQGQSVSEALRLLAQLYVTKYAPQEKRKKKDPTRA